MKKSAFLILLLLLASIQVFAQFSIRPQVGVQFTNLSYESIQGELNGKAGLAVGIDAQIGGTFYVQPGLMINPEKLEIDNVGDINVTKLNVPFMLGYRFFEPDGGRSFGMRVFAGPNFGFNINNSISDAITDITADDLKDFQLSAIAGIGFDISLIFVDLGYKIGLSETISPRVGEGASLNAFMLNAGLRLGF
ncbi:MAG: PorT family outer membrane secretin [Algoriphagus marincola HL-49]|uniref:PorT family outer membrane secretin n=1 Tax=Algoriphagus marincola HL-49 TaxID=1305737 RepID=A0A0N8KFS9_9BACT|nr:MAG: PorT family outer membrane secretin [Algoriphagus marincola HL-49]